MSQFDYDMIVIGSGPGGYVAAIRAAQLGFKTACVEKYPALGGTCLNVGCIPSKTLLYATEIYDIVHTHGSQFGITYDALNMNFDQLMQRKANVVKGLVSGIEGLFQRNKVERLLGEASFKDAHTLQINGSDKAFEVSAKYFIIATGSKPIELPFLPFDEKSIVSSTGALSLSSIPQEMIVIGGGVIGVELASVYRRLGTKVTIVEMLDRLIPTADEEVSRGFLKTIKKQGIEVYLKAKVLSAKKGDKLLLQIEMEKPFELSADVVLVSIGRRPNTKNLNLAAADIQLDAKGRIPVDARFCTRQPHILAIGDVIEGPMLAHRASEEGIVAVEALKGRPTTIDYMALPNVVYTNPEVASVGMTTQEAKELGFELAIGTAYFKGNSRARCTEQIDGFVRVIGDKASGKLLGLHLFGANVSEMIGMGALAIKQRSSLQELAQLSYAHPTLLEAVKEALLNALGQPLH